MEALTTWGLPVETADGIRRPGADPQTAVSCGC